LADWSGPAPPVRICIRCTLLRYFEQSAPEIRRDEVTVRPGGVGGARVQHVAVHADHVAGAAENRLLLRQVRALGATGEGLPQIMGRSVKVRPSNDPHLRCSMSH
jgi:hypothetical protein